MHCVDSLNAIAQSTVVEKADVRTPQLKARHIVVRVAATSVNTVDMMIREMGEAHARLASCQSIGKVI